MNRRSLSSHQMPLYPHEYTFLQEEKDFLQRCSDRFSVYPLKKINLSFYLLFPRRRESNSSPHAWACAHKRARTSTDEHGNRNRFARASVRAVGCFFWSRLVRARTTPPAMS